MEEIFPRPEAEPEAEPTPATTPEVSAQDAKAEVQAEPVDSVPDEYEPVAGRSLAEVEQVRMLEGVRLAEGRPRLPAHHLGLRDPLGALRGLRDLPLAPERATPRRHGRPAA